MNTPRKRSGLIDNEPVVLNRIRKDHPNVQLIFFESTHSGKEEPPADIITINEFSIFQQTGQGHSYGSDHKAVIHISPQKNAVVVFQRNKNKVQDLRTHLIFALGFYENSRQ